MFDKIALNPVKERGFDSKAQMRYLLMMMREDPEKYGWVKDVLRNHGVPKVEGPLRTYWEPPYNVSPETPSYVYTGRAASFLDRIVKLANKLDENGQEKLADKLDSVVRPLFVDEVSAQQVANTFWTIRKNEFDPHEPESILELFEKLSAFRPFLALNPETQEETRRKVSDKILGRST